VNRSCPRTIAAIAAIRIADAIGMIRTIRTVGAVGAVTALGAVIALSGCTSSGTGPGSPAPSSIAALTSAVTPLPDSPATSTAQSTSPAPPSATEPSKTTPPAPPKPTPGGPAACTSTQLKVRALRGSAAAGQEFALITFTNTRSAVCTLNGFPRVSLRLNNAALGQPAQRSAKTPSTVKLAPGKQAQAAITDFSSCQAPVSNAVRVYPPDQGEFVDLPLSLRGCRVVVDPVTLS